MCDRTAITAVTAGFVVALALGSVGCAYRTPEVHVPAALPADVFASDVDVDVRLEHRDADADTTEQVTRWMGKMLPKKEGTSAAHVWVRVDADEMSSLGRGWEGVRAAFRVRTSVMTTSR